MDDLKEAKEHIELARLMRDKIRHQEQDREQMKEILENAKIRIDCAIDEIERVDDMRSTDD
jgi:hypothetical protein